VCLFLAASETADAAQGRVIAEVTAGHALQTGKIIELDLNFTELMRQAGLGGSFDDRSIRVVDERSRSRDLRWQFAPASGYDPAANATGTLIATLASAVEAGEKLRLTIYFGDRPTAAAGAALSGAGVRIVGELEYQGQKSIKIETPSGTYLYHKYGAGFASLFDRDGNDWISYRPGGRSAGEYRGIPNLGAFAHPGYEGAQGTSTVVEDRGPIRVRLRSVTPDDRNATVWDIFPEYARLTVVKTAEPYWFLYEGTPGGKLDVDGDFVVTSTGMKRPVSESWSGDLPGPEWVYFGDAKLNRILFVINQQDDDATDQFWQMEGNMTVFGFGRQFRCCGRYLTANPGVFTIGLAESSDFEKARQVIESAWRPVTIALSKAESVRR
jgi:hypothetical protein